MLANNVQIVLYRPEHQRHFEQLNRQWIEAHFQMEPIDFAVLQNPELHILKEGGQIFMGIIEGTIVATTALKLVTPGIYEFTKMAVDEKWRGKKVGYAIAVAAIDWAREQGAARIILYSNTKLTTAINMYRKLGFVEIPVDGPYTRADIKMQLTLIAND